MASHIHLLQGSNAYRRITNPRRRYLKTPVVRSPVTRIPWKYKEFIWLWPRRQNFPTGRGIQRTSLYVTGSASNECNTLCHLLGSLLHASGIKLGHQAGRLRSLAPILVAWCIRYVPCFTCFRSTVSYVFSCWPCTSITWLFFSSHSDGLCTTRFVF